MRDALIDVTGPRLRWLFHGLAGAFLAASLAGMLWLSAGYVDRLRAEYLDERNRQFERQAGELDAHLMRAANHILRMRLLAERALADPRLPPAPALQPVRAGDAVLAYGWDALRGSPGETIGSLYYVAPPATPLARREPDVVNAVFPYVAAQHQADPSLHLSYYISFLHTGIGFYPYLTLDALLRTSGARNLDDFFRRSYPPEQRERALRAVESSPMVWSNFYPDAAGAGNVVSVYGPVRADGRVIGIVGSDISVDRFILGFLRDRAAPGTELRLIGRNGSYVSSAGSMVTEPATRSDAFAGWRHDGEDLLARVALRNAPFLLQLRVPQASVLQPVETIARGLWLLGALMVALFVGAWFLATRYFVRPSLELAEVVLEERSPEAARLPRLWSGVLARLQAARRERERLHAELREEHELLERRVESRTADLARLNRELQAYNHAVSHDLRAPARSMAGFAALLREDFGEQLPAEAREHLQRIERGAQRMSEMIEGLTRLSRLERHELRREQVDLGAVCADVVEALQRADPAHAPGILIAPDLRVWADAALLRSLMENLLGNAWKFTAHTPGARIRVYAEERAGRTFVCVEDNGAGFDEAQAERLFLPFQRAHAEHEFAGTGIGLSTVKRIVERHGGVVSARGSPGHGACIAFSLPDADAPTGGTG